MGAAGRARRTAASAGRRQERQGGPERGDRHRRGRRGDRRGRGDGRPRPRRRRQGREGRGTRQQRLAEPRALHRRAERGRRAPSGTTPPTRATASPRRSPTRWCPAGRSSPTPSTTTPSTCPRTGRSARRRRSSATGRRTRTTPSPGPRSPSARLAFYKESWCKVGNSKYTRAIVGSKGGQGSRNTAEGAEIAAENFVYFAYGEQKDTVKLTKAKKFSNEHGITGHIASATATGVEKENKCDSDGKVVTVSWIDGSNDLRIWVLVTDAGVDDEVSRATIDKMTGSLRPYAEED
ncbi:hypothetical protein LUW77_29185 [Streptomyces radiopugnans]|nr:hypothetical protein LUW77_29185 [Streptomyces radiopugnans]